MEIKSVKIFANNNVLSNKVKHDLEKELLKADFKILNENYDLAIAIGGDGSFLRMIKENNFNSDIYYIGVNTGTLGFAQEIKANEYKQFVVKLKENKYKVESLGIEETLIKQNDEINKFYSLNEIVIRDSELNTTGLNIKVSEVFLEHFVGDGLLISTSFGSTAYNLSFGGSIIFNDLHTLQITPIAPLNSKAYRCLNNSIVIPENKVISIIPDEDKKNLIISIDGVNYFYDNVKEIETFVKNKKIKCLRELDYDFSKKVNQKFL